MFKKVTFINVGGVIAGTVKEAFKRAQMDVNDVEPKAEVIRQLVGTRDVIVILLGDYPHNNEDFYKELSNLCSMQDRLFILGEQLQINDFKKLVPGVIISKEFRRPFNTNDIVEAIEAHDVDESSVINRKKILVIDDDPIYLRSVKQWLSGDFAVSVVSSGFEAIKYLINATPDLILLDYQMPAANGPTVFSMIRDNEATKNIPIIFLTGKSDKESVMKVLELKPDGYLLKKMNGLQIHRAIKEYFESPDHKIRNNF